MFIVLLGQTLTTCTAMHVDISSVALAFLNTTKIRDALIVRWKS